MGRPTAHTAHRHRPLGSGGPHSRAHGYINCLKRRRGTFSALGSTPATDPPGLGRSQVFFDRAHPALETDFAPQDSGAPEPSLTGLSRPPTQLPPRLGCSRAFLRPSAPGRSRHRYLRDSGAPEPSFDRAPPAVLDTDTSETRALPGLLRQRYLRDSGAPEPSFDRALPAFFANDTSVTRALPSLS
ncbi:hypothetical protein PUN28_018001 [Cardiocondyla obscurior]|uniref:Uncharacterized protein n=1 Tax=Cardiocondyla obscurior TaxID=286306 RepID=A0AAW2EHH4_9HYME